jgi:hypothetical protein
VFLLERCDAGVRFTPVSLSPRIKKKVRERKTVGLTSYPGPTRQLVERLEVLQMGGVGTYIVQEHHSNQAPDHVRDHRVEDPSLNLREGWLLVGEKTWRTGKGSVVWAFTFVAKGLLDKASGPFFVSSWQPFWQAKLQIIRAACLS